MKPVKMRILSWHGPLPELGDQMETPAGTRYLVLGVRPTRPGSKSVATADLLKFPAGEKPEHPRSRVHQFAWCPRG